jgi:hypothetical protein
MVQCIRNLSYVERLKILEIPTLAYRRVRGDIIQVWKLLNGKEDKDYNVFFEKAQLDHVDNHHIRGNSMRLKIKSCKKEIRKHFFSLRVVPEWNRLPVMWYVHQCFKFVKKTDLIKL